MKYFKLTNEKEKHNEFQYKTGLNVDTLPFESNPKKSCCEGGLYFSDAKNICGFLNHMFWIREVTIPENENMLLDPDGDKWRIHSFILSERKPLSDVDTWKWMIKNGVDITANDNLAIRWASQNGHLKVVKYLHENGADITANTNFGIRWASRYGHLKVVKYLHENGADITASGNFAIRWASRNGHLEVVKYLYENGADITVDDNYAIRWASHYGHLKVVKYLKENGGKL